MKSILKYIIEAENKDKKLKKEKEIKDGSVRVFERGFPGDPVIYAVRKNGKDVFITKDYVTGPGDAFWGEVKKVGETWKFADGKESFNTKHLGYTKEEAVKAILK